MISRNYSTDPSALPLACPQPSTAVNSQDTSEDCLSMLIYVPSTAAQGKIPALMWYVLKIIAVVTSILPGHGVGGLSIFLDRVPNLDIGRLLPPIVTILGRVDHGGFCFPFVFVAGYVC